MDWRQYLRDFLNTQNRQMSDRELVDQARSSLQGMLTDIQTVMEGLNELRDALSAALADTERLR